MIGKRWCAALAVVVLVSFAWTWAQAGDEQKALENAVGYLLKNQAESGGWPRDRGVKSTLGSYFASRFTASGSQSMSQDRD